MKNIFGHLPPRVNHYIDVLSFALITGIVAFFACAFSLDNGPLFICIVIVPPLVILAYGIKNDPARKQAKQSVPKK